MADKLKPCPFCGGVAQVNGPIGGTFSIYQQHSLDCPVGGGERNYETEAEAIAAWNTRADAARIEALEAAVEKLLRCLMPVTMGLAQAECVDEPLADGSVVLSFMGSGASDQVTAGEVRAAIDAARALKGEQGNG